MKPIRPLRRMAILMSILLLAAAVGCVPAGGTFTVNNSGDGGDSSPGDGYCRTGSSLTDCTLRAAMEEANALGGAQTIRFNLPAADTVVYPAAALPQITDAVTIDGTSQPEFDGGKPRVRVDGSHLGAGPAASGFRIAAGVDATIQGLQIMRFTRHGIENLGGLQLDHLEVALNQASGINSFKAADGVNITLNNSTVFENAGPGVNGINTHFTMDSVTMDRNTGGGLRVVGGSLILDHGGIADNAVPTDGGGVFLSMAGNPDIRNTTIEGNTSGLKGGGLYLWGLPGTMLMMNNCTFDGNYGYDGGGIYVDAGTSHLAASTLINNRAKRHGGGVFVNTNNSPAFWVEDGTVIGRTGEGNIAGSAPAAGGLGGGIYNTMQLNISESSIEGNTGDGIYNDGGEVRILDSSASFNTLSGIESFHSGTTVEIIAERVTIARNGNSGIGAINAELSVVQGSIRENGFSGIRMNGGTLAMDRSEVVGNHTGGDGGGIAGYNLAGEIRNSTVSGNVAGASGGGLYLWALPMGGGVNLVNLTVSGNTAGTLGGGLHAAMGTIRLNNVTIARNTAPASGGMQNAAAASLANTLLAENAGGNCLGLPTSLGNNLDDGVSCALAGPGDRSGLPANLGPLADNGGGTFTHALLPGSAALEAGNDAACAAADQRGVIRPQGLHCDIGAYESETPATATPPAVTSTLTPTLTPTGTPTPTAPAKILFDPVELSSDKLFQGGKSCDPKTLTIKVRVTPSDLISSVGLFYRIVAKQGSQNYPWGGGLAMIPAGGGWYELTLSGDDLPSIGRWQTEAWLDFQFVANDAGHQPIAWSPVIRRVTFWQCYV